MVGAYWEFFRDVPIWSCFNALRAISRSRGTALCACFPLRKPHDSSVLPSTPANGVACGPMSIMCSHASEFRTLLCHVQTGHLHVAYDRSQAQVSIKNKLQEYGRSCHELLHCLMHVSSSCTLHTSSALQFVHAGTLQQCRGSIWLACTFQSVMGFGLDFEHGNNPSHVARSSFHQQCIGRCP